jgi:hypothetical protein
MTSVFNNSTAGGCAGAGCGPESTGCDFLNPSSKSNISHVIEVGDGAGAYILRGYNIQPGQHLVVEIVSGTGDGTMTAQHWMNGKRLELNTDNTVLMLKNSGRYRVVAVDDAGKPIPAGLLMPTVCAEKADSVCGCSEGTEPPKPVCPSVTVTLDASVAKQLTATVVGGPGIIELTPSGYVQYGSGPFVFTGLEEGKSYVATFVSDCGSKGSAGAITKAAAPTYCPGLRFEACDCADTGFGYYDNALKDPAATVKVTACDGTTVMWIYPTSGMTGNVRHEVPYSEVDGVVLGYLANNSDCAPPASCCTTVSVAAPVVNVAAPAVTNNVTLPAPTVVSTEWVGTDGALKITLSDGSSVTSQPIPACDN